MMAGSAGNPTSSSSIRQCETHKGYTPMNEKTKINSSGTLGTTTNGGIDMHDVLKKIPITKFPHRNSWLGIAGLYKAAGGLFKDFLMWCKGDSETFKDEDDCRNAWSIDPKETMVEAKRRLLAIAGIKPHSKETPIADTSADTPAEQVPTADTPAEQMLQNNVTVDNSGQPPQVLPSLPPMERDRAIQDAMTIVKTIHPNLCFIFSMGAKDKINTKMALLDNTEEELLTLLQEALLYEEERKDGLFWQLNEATLSGKLTVRANGITSFTWGLLESDDLPIADQYALLKSISLPLFAAVHSGGKSIHAFIHIGAHNAEEYKIRIAKVYQYAADHGLLPDQACKSLGRWCRFPLATREDGYQYPVIVNKQFLTYEEWEDQTLHDAFVPISPADHHTGKDRSQGSCHASVSIPLAGDENDGGKKPMLRYCHVEKCIANSKHHGEIRYNELNGEFDISGFSWLKRNPGEDRLEVVADEVQAFLHMRYSHVTHELVVRHLQKIGRDHSYNPIKEHLERETWDGQDRFNKLCATLTPMDDFSRLLVRKWLIQGIAMLYNEGNTNANGVLTLQGPEGIGKTSFFRSLVPEIGWFQEGIAIDTESKDSIRKAISKWISEIGECDHTTKKQQANLKAFITQNSDRYRREYERTIVEVPRRTSFCATVNNDAFLYEGDNRRWWVIKVARVDFAGLNALKSEVWQIWAQAKYEWDKNHKAYELIHEELAELCKRNIDFQVKLGYQDILEEHFDWDADPVRWREMESKELREIFDIKPAESQRFGTAVNRLIKNHDLKTRILHGYKLVKLPPQR